MSVRDAASSFAEVRLLSSSFRSDSSSSFADFNFASSSVVSCSNAEDISFKSDNSTLTASNCCFKEVSSSFADASLDLNKSNSEVRRSISAWSSTTSDLACSSEASDSFSLLFNSSISSFIHALSLLVASNSDWSCSFSAFSSSNSDLAASRDSTSAFNESDSAFSSSMRPSSSDTLSVYFASSAPVPSCSDNEFFAASSSFANSSCWFSNEEIFSADSFSWLASWTTDVSRWSFIASSSLVTASSFFDATSHSSFLFANSSFRAFAFSSCSAVDTPSWYETLDSSSLSRDFSCRSELISSSREANSSLWSIAIVAVDSWWSRSVRSRSDWTKASLASASFRSSATIIISSSMFVAKSLNDSNSLNNAEFSAIAFSSLSAESFFSEIKPATLSFSSFNSTVNSSSFNLNASRYDVSFSALFARFFVISSFSFCKTFSCSCLAVISSDAFFIFSIRAVFSSVTSLIFSSRSVILFCKAAVDSAWVSFNFFIWSSAEDILLAFSSIAAFFSANLSSKSFFASSSDCCKSLDLVFSKESSDWAASKHSNDCFSSSCSSLNCTSLELSLSSCCCTNIVFSSNANFKSVLTFSNFVKSSKIASSSPFWLDVIFSNFVWRASFSLRRLAMVLSNSSSFCASAVVSPSSISSTLAFCSLYLIIHSIASVFCPFSNWFRNASASSFNTASSSLSFVSVLEERWAIRRSLHLRTKVSCWSLRLREVTWVSRCLVVSRRVASLEFSLEFWLRSAVRVTSDDSASWNWNDSGTPEELILSPILSTPPSWFLEANSDLSLAISACKAVTLPQVFSFKTALFLISLALCANFNVDSVSDRDWTEGVTVATGPSTIHN